VIARAGLNLNSDVTEARNLDKPRLVTGGRFRLVRNQRNDGGAMAGADAPNVEVGYAIFALRFEAMRDLAGDRRCPCCLDAQGRMFARLCPRYPPADQNHEPSCATAL